MQDVRYIEEVEQALVLLKPQRLEILKRLAEPRTCPELAVIFDDSPQKIYYHVKALEAAGFVDKIAERRVRGARRFRRQNRRAPCPWCRRKHLSGSRALLLACSVARWPNRVTLAGP